MNGPNKGAYWPSWSRSCPPSAIDTTLFTHIYYAFVNPIPNANNTTFELEINEPALLRDFTTTLHRNNPAIKTLLSIGGYSEELSKVFSRMASTRDLRSRFIRSTIQVARLYNFDGLDFDWEYPETQTDMENFGRLLEEWRVAVNKEAPVLLLSAAAYCQVETPFDGAHAYPVESMKKNLDWINVMCYDYHGSWTPHATGTLAALHDPNGNISTSHALQSWIDAGIQRKKLVMGLPLYGRTWRLKDPSFHGIGAPAVGVGPGNDEAGYMLYAEVQEFNAQNNAKVVFDEATVSYYSIAGTSWIGYDDVRSVERKIEYAQSLKIGGYFFWSVDGDQDWKISRLALEKWN